MKNLGDGTYSTYNGNIKRWVDGDTVEVNTWQEDVDVSTAYGIKTTVTTRREKTETYRLTIIDTAEKGDNPGYQDAKDYVNDVFPPGISVVVYTHGIDNGGFGRTLADVVHTPGGDTASNLLLREGLAKVWKPR